MILSLTAGRKLHHVGAGAVIDSISTAPMDTEIALPCDGDCVIQDAGNIRLSGRVDMEGTKGDLICLISAGNLWHETSRVVK